MLLEISELTVRYGRVMAVKSAGLDVAEGEAVAVLGANGAGKSSLLKGVLGLVRAEGSVRIAGSQMARRPVHERVAAGIGLVPEGRRIVASLTVEENLQLGALRRRDPEAVRAEVGAIYARFENLGRHRHSPACVLSGGEQQMLAIGRALLARPRVLMLDEPSLGLSPLLVQQLFAYLTEVRDAGTAMLLVEQNTSMALRFAQRAYVMELGKLAHGGASSELLQDDSLVKAYLGGDCAPAGSPLQPA